MRNETTKLLELIRNAKRVYLVGNGGSAANAIHICNDLLAVGVKAYTLDIATLTASANDFGYETVFERWISVVGERGDLLLCLSGSGNSKNILRAIKMAKKRNMTTFLLTGAFAKEPVLGKAMAHYCIRTGIDMQEAEEDQLMEGHTVYRALKK